MRSPVELAFALQGALSGSPPPGATCPTDELLAGYGDDSLSASQQRVLEDHALGCAACFELVKLVAGSRPERLAAPPRVSVVARLMQRGLELLNPLEVVLRRLVSGDQPALGLARRAESVPEGTTDVLVVQGPGRGIDELLIQLQADGLVRLQVRGDTPPALQHGEISSVILEVDGSPREKRPYTGATLAFAPQGHGRYRIRLVARAPGSAVRELCEAAIELRG